MFHHLLSILYIYIIYDISMIYLSCTINHLLFLMYYPLYVIDSLSYVIYHLLSIIDYLLSIIYYLLCIIYHPLSIIYIISISIVFFITLYYSYVYFAHLHIHVPGGNVTGIYEVLGQVESSGRSLIFEPIPDSWKEQPKNFVMVPWRGWC